MKLHKAKQQIKRYIKKPSKGNLPIQSFNTAMKCLDAYEWLENEVAALCDLYSEYNDLYEKSVHDAYTSVLIRIRRTRDKIEKEEAE